MSELDYEQYHQKGGTYVIPVEVFDNLLEENQSSKNQLEEYKKWYQDELEENSKLSELWCDSRAKIRELENQQKEFIEYLENEIYSFELRGTSPEYNFENVLKRILLKYKSILGENNG